MTVKLSSLLDSTVNQSQESPSIQNMNIIRDIVCKTDEVDSALLCRIVKKMLSYKKKKLQQPKFRIQVQKQNFVNALLLVGNMQNHYSNNSPLGFKVRKIIAYWGLVYVSDLPEYRKMYLHYSKINVIDPSYEPERNLPNGTEELIPHLESNIIRIQNVLTNPNNSQNLQRIYSHAKKLYGKFNSTFNSPNQSLDSFQYDPSMMHQVRQLGQTLSLLLIQLKEKLDCSNSIQHDYSNGKNKSHRIISKRPGSSPDRHSITKQNVNLTKSMEYILPISPVLNTTERSDKLTPPKKKKLSLNRSFNRELYAPIDTQEQKPLDLFSFEDSDRSIEKVNTSMNESLL
ncbi:VHS domain-containing protein [Entamoeba marina]